MSVEYPYATGDRLEKRNSYAYTRYQGRPFLDAWRRSRQAVLEALPTPAPPDAPAPASAGESSTAPRLADLRADLLQGHRYAEFNLLLRHFEVSKRIFGRYTDAWRPEDRDDYRDLSLYLQFSELVVLAYEQTGLLPYLNALLKCVDTLVALRERLTEAGQARLARLILAERAHLDRLESPP